MFDFNRRLLGSEEEFHAFPARALQLDSFQDKYAVPTKGFREGSAIARSANKIANQKGETIRLRSHCSFASRSRWLLYLGKAIKGEQWTDEVGASAMWRPCFALPGACFSPEERTREEDREYIVAEKWRLLIPQNQKSSVRYSILTWKERFC